jgi:hypothetical protein
MPVQGAGTPGHVPVRLCPLALPTVGRVGDHGAIRAWRRRCGDHGLSPFNDRDGLGGPWSAALDPPGR